MTEAALIGKATHPDKIDNILYGKPWLTDLCAKHKEKTIELTTDTGANFLLYIDKGGMFKVLTSSVPRAYGPSRNPSVVLEGEQNKSNVELPTSRPMYIHAYSENRVKQALDGLSVGNELSCKVVSKKSQKLIPAKIKKDKGGRLVVTDAREPAVLAISGGGMSHVPGKEWFDMPNGEQINANPGRWIHPQTLRLLPNEKTIGKAPAALVKARV